MTGQFERVLLYVGPPKTGSTSIQAFVWKNRDPLMAQGIYVPTTGRGGSQHIELPAIIAQNARGPRKKRLNSQAHIGEEDGSARREKFLADLDHELSDAPRCHTLLFMSEAIFASELSEVHAYREVLAPYAARLESLMYLRRQDRWLASRTLQNRKSGNRFDLKLNVGAPHRFAANVRAWHSESDRCLTRRFDREFLLNGSLIQDFCATVGADASPLDIDEIWNNPAILQEQLELVDALNRKIEPLPFRNKVRIRSPFLALCTETLGGAKVGFPRAEAVDLFESFREINQWLRDTIDPSGPPLFFNADFDGYEDAPANDRRYSMEQLGRLLEVIAPGTKPAPERDALIEQMLAAFMARRAILA